HVLVHHGYPGRVLIVPLVEETSLKQWNSHCVQVASRGREHHREGKLGGRRYRAAGDVERPWGVALEWQQTGPGSSLDSRKSWQPMKEMLGKGPGCCRVCKGSRRK